MKLLIIRHAIAMDREEFHKQALLSARASGGDHKKETNDGLRPLTEEGTKKMRKNARGIRAIVGVPDLIASSPLRRR